MQLARLTSFGLLAGLVAAAAPARAEPFKCPRVGGNFVFGQEANINSLDQMTSSTISTRNIAMNMFESLMTRDENFSPILELADSLDESADHLTYTFKLRQGVHFHNGKPMTSADVVASFDRYAKVGLQRSTLDNVARWDAPDKNTFVIHMKKVQPTFIEALSSFSVPIVIIPAEQKDDPPQQLKTIGTGPYAAGRVGARQLREAAALRRLPAQPPLRAADRLRRLQAGLLRHGHLPYRHRAAGAAWPDCRPASCKASRTCRRNRCPS